MNQWKSSIVLRFPKSVSVIEPKLQDLIKSALRTGFSREEILIVVSELVAEDFATVMTPQRPLRQQVILDRST